MKPEYDTNNSGVLFKNVNKTPTDKRPDYRGSLIVAKREYNISGWVRKSQKTGLPFLSLKVEEKPAETMAPYKPNIAQNNAPTFDQDLNDDINF